MKIKPAASSLPHHAGTSSLGYLGGARPKVPVKRPVVKPVVKPTTAPTAAASATVAQGTVGPAGLPVDPAYDQTVAGLGDRRDQLLAGYQGQRQQGLLDYGYTEDAQGVPKFDPTNPLSRASQMKRRYDQSRKGANTSYAARGQLYSGAYQRARDEVNYQQSAGDDSLLKSLGSFLAGNTGNQAGAKTDFELGVGGAMGDRVGRAPSNPLYAPVTGQAASSPSAATPAAVPVAKPKPKPKVTQVDPNARVDAVLPSKAHGGRLWMYTRTSTGKLIPIGPK